MDVNEILGNVIRLVGMKPFVTALLEIYLLLGRNLFFSVLATSFIIFALFLPGIIMSNRNVARSVYRRALHNDLRRRHSNDRSYRRALDALAVSNPLPHEGLTVYIPLQFVCTLLMLAPMSFFAYVQRKPESRLDFLAERSFGSYDFATIFPMNSGMLNIDLLEPGVALPLLAALISVISTRLAFPPKLYPGEGRGIPYAALFTITSVVCFLFGNGISLCFAVVGLLYVATALVQNGDTVVKATLLPSSDDIFPETLEPEAAEPISREEIRERRRMRKRNRRGAGKRRGRERDG